jgi:hypothetical protein
MSVDVINWKKINVLLSLRFGGVGKKKTFNTNANLAIPILFV